MTRRRLELVDGRAGSGVSAVDGAARAASPVVARGDDVGVAEIAAGETEVAGAERAVTLVEVAEVRGDVRVVSDTATGEAPEVAAEAVQARVELFEDDGLGLNLADLLGDDPLGHLLEDKQALLNDLNRLAVADNFLFLYDDSLRDFSREVVRTVEVIKSRERFNAHIVVE